MHNLEFSGERCLVNEGTFKAIHLEHLHRYQVAMNYCAGKKVLDIACGSGYGSDMLAVKAKSVVGVDISGKAISFARENYTRDNLSFMVGGVEAIPCQDHSFDLVVSFETFEHVDAKGQVRFLREIRRVLAPGGLLVMSTVNKKYYTDEVGAHNPFHIHELYRKEFTEFIRKEFRCCSFLDQRIYTASLLLPELKRGVQWDIFLSEKNKQNKTCSIKSAAPDNFWYVVALASDSPIPSISSSINLDIKDDIRLQREKSSLKNYEFGQEQLANNQLLLKRNTELEKDIKKNYEFGQEQLANNQLLLKRNTELEKDTKKNYEFGQEQLANNQLLLKRNTELEKDIKKNYEFGQEQLANNQILLKKNKELENNLVQKSDLLDELVGKLNETKALMQTHMDSMQQQRILQNKVSEWIRHKFMIFQIKNLMSILRSGRVIPLMFFVFWKLKSLFLHFGLLKGGTYEEYVIGHSGLFDEDYYRINNSDVRGNLLRHYCLQGWKEGRNPSADFNTNQYLSVNLDVRNMNPLYHYIVYGVKENRPLSDSDLKLRKKCWILRTCDFFDSDFLRSQVALLRDNINLDPVEYYVLFGKYLIDNPSRSFDVQDYVKAHPEVSLYHCNPVFYHLDYVLGGLNQSSPEIREEMQAIALNGLFQESYYLRCHEAEIPSGMTALEHYCLIGWRKSYWPHENFDPIKFMSHHGDASGNPAYQQVVLAPNEIAGIVQQTIAQKEDFSFQVKKVFDSDFYRNKYSDVGTMSPLEHFCKYGVEWNREINPDLSIEFYCQIHPEYTKPSLWKEVLSILEECVYIDSKKCSEGEKIIHNSCFFDVDFYMKKYGRYMFSAEETPEHHYCRIGWKLGFNPSGQFDTRNFYLSHSLEIPEDENPLEYYLKSICRDLKKKWTAGPRNLIKEASFLYKNEIPEFKPFSETVDVIIPVYNGLKHLQVLLPSLFKNTTTQPHRFIFVDDCSPDKDTVDYIREQIYDRKDCVYLRNKENLGFPGTVNHGVHEVRSSVFVLLNTDVIVPEFWLERLLAPFKKDVRIGTTTPFTNSAVFFSFPTMGEDNKLARPEDFFRIDQRFQHLNADNIEQGEFINGTGFCMGVRKSCWDCLGEFDAKAFGKGYGEECDWCFRILNKGWKNVLVPNLYVYHNHGGTFVPETKKKLVTEHLSILRERWEKYMDLLDDFVMADPWASWRMAALLRGGGMPEVDRLVIDLDQKDGGACMFRQQAVKNFLEKGETIALLVYSQDMPTVWRFGWMTSFGEALFRLRNFEEAENMIRLSSPKKIFVNNFAFCQELDSLLGFFTGKSFWNNLCATDLQPLGEITRGMEISQDIYVKKNGLYSVGLFAATYMRKNSGHIRFVLKDVQSDEILSNQLVAVDDVSDNCFMDFEFPVIWNSGGKTYRIVIQGIDGAKENAITFYGLKNKGEKLLKNGEISDLGFCRRLSVVNTDNYCQMNHIEVKYHFHDFLCCCPSFFLLGKKNVFCDFKDCANCLADNGNVIYAEKNLRKWREKWGRFLERCTSYRFFSENTFKLVSRVYSLNKDLVEIRAHDSLVKFKSQFVFPAKGASFRLAVLGALAISKGSEQILKLAFFLKKHRPDMQIRFYGNSYLSQDQLDVFPDNFIYCGKYQLEELPEILVREGICAVFMSSVYPETYSFVTSECIEIGVPLLGFHLGASGDRIQQYRYGFLAEDFSTDAVYRQILKIEKCFYH